MLTILDTQAYSVTGRIIDMYTFTSSFGLLGVVKGRTTEVFALKFLVFLSLSTKYSVVSVLDTLSRWLFCQCRRQLRPWWTFFVLIQVSIHAGIVRVWLWQVFTSGVEIRVVSGLAQSISFTCCNDKQGLSGTLPTPTIRWRSNLYRRNLL